MINVSLVLVHIGIEINEGQTLAKVVGGRGRRTGKPLELLTTGVGVYDTNVVVQSFVLLWVGKSLVHKLCLYDRKGVWVETIGVEIAVDAEIFGGDAPTIGESGGSGILLGEIDVGTIGVNECGLSILFDNEGILVLGRWVSE